MSQCSKFEFHALVDREPMKMLIIKTMDELCQTLTDFKKRHTLGMVECLHNAA